MVPAEWALVIGGCLLAARVGYKLQERIIRWVKWIRGWWAGFKLRPRGTRFWCWILEDDLQVHQRDSMLFRRCDRCYVDEYDIRFGKTPTRCKWIYHRELRIWETGCDWEFYHNPASRRCPNCRRVIETEVLSMLARVELHNEAAGGMQPIAKALMRPPQEPLSSLYEVEWGPGPMPPRKHPGCVQ
jgi:hypothetical protein